MRENVAKAKKKQQEYLDNKTTEVSFKVGETVYHKNNSKKNKLSKKWVPYGIVIEQTGPVSYRIKNQLTGSVTKAHAADLRSAKIDEWKISDDNHRAMRNATLAAPIHDSDSDDMDTDSVPQQDELDRCRKQKQNAEDECSVPLFERAVTKIMLDSDRPQQDHLTQSVQNTNSESLFPPSS